jgi:hypothetical protein
MKVLKFFLSSIFLLTMVLVFSMQAHADLNLLGQGTSAHGTYNLIYDTDLDITWYDYSNFNNNTWQNQVDWADALSVTFGSNTYTDWRLPTTVDGPYVWGNDGTTTAGYNITSSEIGHLFYEELGNEGNYDTFGNKTGCDGSPWPYCLTNTGDFQNLQSNQYWSGTVRADYTDDAWNFYLSRGSQDSNLKVDTHYAIAVMDGKADAPEPVSSTLFIVGGATLGFWRFRKKFKK